MSELLIQIQDRLLYEYDIDVSVLGSREVKIFIGAVVFVPVTYLVVETCKFLWKIRWELHNVSKLLYVFLI